MTKHQWFIVQYAMLAYSHTEAKTRLWETDDGPRPTDEDIDAAVVAFERACRSVVFRDKQDEVHRRLSDILIGLHNGLSAIDRARAKLAGVFPSDCPVRRDLVGAADFVQKARRDLHELYHTDQLTAPLVPYGIAERSEA